MASQGVKVMADKSCDVSSKVDLEGSGQILTPFQRKSLQNSLKDDLPVHYRLRIQIMLLADQGHTQTQICKALGCAQGTVRHWMLIAQSGQAHKWKDRAIGRPKNINDEHLERLKDLVDRDPRDLGYPFKQWTGAWLSKQLQKEFGISVSGDHINRLLRQHGLSKRLKTNAAEDITQQSSVEQGRITILDLQPNASSEFSPNLINATFF